jgi:hypothetical protein
VWHCKTSFIHYFVSLIFSCFLYENTPNLQFSIPCWCLTFIPYLFHHCTPCPAEWAFQLSPDSCHGCFCLCDFLSLNHTSSFLHISKSFPSSSDWAAQVRPAAWRCACYLHSNLPLLLVSLNYFI